jgi:hypothetical protein
MATILAQDEAPEPSISGICNRRLLHRTAWFKAEKASQTTPKTSLEAASSSRKAHLSSSSSSMYAAWMVGIPSYLGRPRREGYWRGLPQVDNFYDIYKDYLGGFSLRPFMPLRP